MTVKCLHTALKAIKAKRAAYLLLSKAHHVCEQRKRSASESRMQSSSRRHTNNHHMYNKGSSSFSHPCRPNTLLCESGSEGETDDFTVTAIAVTQSISTMSTFHIDSDSVELSDTESPRHV